MSTSRALAAQHVDTNALVTMAVVDGDPRYNGADRAMTSGIVARHSAGDRGAGTVAALHRRAGRERRRRSPASVPTAAPRRCTGSIPRSIARRPGPFASFRTPPSFLDIGTPQDYLDDGASRSPAREGRPLDRGAGCGDRAGRHARSTPCSGIDVTVGAGASPDQLHRRRRRDGSGRRAQSMLAIGVSLPSTARTTETDRGALRPRRQRDWSTANDSTWNHASNSTSPHSGSTTARRCVPLTGDASDRRYFRVLLKDATPIVLALHPGPIDFATMPFVAVARLLAAGAAAGAARFCTTRTSSACSASRISATSRCRRTSAPPPPAEHAALYRQAVTLIARMQQRGEELRVATTTRPTASRSTSRS